MRFIVIVGLCLALIAPDTRGQSAVENRPYAGYATLLSRYVVDGRVDYAAWRTDDPAAWGRFLAWLEAAEPASMPLLEQRAFWINAYNARTIAGILERYPLESVRDVGFLGGRVRGFFSRREHPVAGHLRTLDEIEREILLAEPLRDSRVHWALVCGSTSCPRLRPEPYRDDRLDTQLDFQARTFLNSPDGHRLDPERNVLYLSKIFDWYEEDFRRAAGSVGEYAARYLTGAAGMAARDPAWRIEYLDYDWSLNDLRR